MPEDKKVEIVLNAEELIRALELIEDKAEQTEEIVKTVSEKSDDMLRSSYFKALGLARSAYTIGLGMVKASGQSVSYFFRAMISATFGAIQTLYPLFKALIFKGAGTYNAYEVAMALLGMAELAVATISVKMAEREESDIARGMRGVAMSLGGLNSLLSQIPRW